MLGVDDDDKESIDWVNNEAADFVSPFGCACKAKVMEGSVNMDVNYALDEDEVEEGGDEITPLIPRQKSPTKVSFDLSLI